jgi:hypothetical protein
MERKEVAAVTPKSAAHPCREVQARPNGRGWRQVILSKSKVGKYCTDCQSLLRLKFVLAMLEGFIACFL